MRLRADYTPLKPRKPDTLPVCCECGDEIIDGGYSINGDCYCGFCFEDLTAEDICKRYVDEFKQIGGLYDE